MGSTTKIEWTERTWNPSSGCSKISAGCDNCYAETIAERFRGHAAFPKGFDVQLRHEKVNDPLTWRKPARVFVNSMSDLFHQDIDAAWIADIFAVMAAARKHTFQLLTKRHARMRHLLNDPAFVDQVRSRALGKGLPADQWQWPLANVWLGVSVEDQRWADIRIPALLHTPAAVRFLSCEPLLGPVDLTRLPYRGDCDYVIDALAGRYGIRDPRESFRFGMAGLGTIDWVISGGESGRNARPAHPDWFRSLRDQCTSARVAYFHKQNGEWNDRTALTGDQRAAVSIWDEKHVTYVHPADGRTQAHGAWGANDHLEGWACVQRVGKKAAGRELDGRTHDEFPVVR
jgi:protein gp37